MPKKIIRLRHVKAAAEKCGMKVQRLESKMNEDIWYTVTSNGYTIGLLLSYSVGVYPSGKVAREFEFSLSNSSSLSPEHLIEIWEFVSALRWQLLSDHVC